MNNVTVILRECGERTADNAYRLLQNIFPATCLHRVCEIPFSLAVCKSFEIGIASQRAWTLCIDADVLVSERGIRELMAVAAFQDSRVFELQGFVGDKFFATFRPAGNHLYRTEHLPQALTCVPNEGTTTRPEHTTILAMRATGLVDVQIPSLVGIHDFDQYYSDIFRKCFLQAHKHAWMSDFLSERWNRLTVGDEDFRVALAGFTRAQTHIGEVLVDKRFGAEDFASFAEQSGLAEKERLAQDAWTADRVGLEIQDLLSSTDPGVIEQQAVLTQYFFIAPKLSALKSEQTGLARWINNLLRFVGQSKNASTSQNRTHGQQA